MSLPNTDLEGQLDCYRIKKSHGLERVNENHAKYVCVCVCVCFFLFFSSSGGCGKIKL